MGCTRPRSFLGDLVSNGTVNVKCSEQQSCKGCVHLEITRKHTLGFIIYSIIRNHLLEWQQHDANHTRLGFPASSRVRFWGHIILCDDQASDLTGVISGAAASVAGAEAAWAVASPSQ